MTVCLFSTVDSTVLSMPSKEVNRGISICLIMCNMKAAVVFLTVTYGAKSQYFWILFLQAAQSANYRCKHIYPHNRGGGEGALEY